MVQLWEEILFSYNKEQAYFKLYTGSDSKQNNSYVL